MKEVEKIEIAGSDDISTAVAGRSQPVVLKGLVADWPLVRAGRESAHAASEYLRSYYNDAPVTISVGEPEARGRIFYNEQFSGFNFATVRGRLDGVLDAIDDCEKASDPPVHYMGSTTVDLVLPGLRDENDLPFGAADPSIRIWIGNRTRVAAHFDIPQNVACVAVGRRRFTLFPPDQLENLYIGPLDLTPAGQSISLVDLHQPDFDKFPKFRKALAHAQVAEMEPGDAIFVPSMWWHHVEGLDALNVLVNYWWLDRPAFLGSPLDALNHALLSIRDLPDEQRDVWRDIFEHYVFGDTREATSHIPESARGALSPLTDDTARRLRALLIRNLNR